MILVINGQAIDVPGGGLPEGTVAIKPLTRAEYDILTDEERQADVVYAITDDPPSSGSPWEIYSAEETRIGTWIDGKPLYRTTIVTTSPSYGNAHVAIYKDVDSVETVVGLTGVVKRSDFFEIVPDRNIILTYRLDSKAISMYVSSEASGSLSCPCMIIFEYTKTTDAGGVI